MNQKLIDKKAREDYNEQVKFNSDPDNDKWKSAHRKVFLDTESEGDSMYE